MPMRSNIASPMPTSAGSWASRSTSAWRSTIVLPVASSTVVGPASAAARSVACSVSSISWLMSVIGSPLAARRYVSGA